MIVCLRPSGALDLLEARPANETLLFLYNFSFKTQVGILSQKPSSVLPWGDLPLGVIAKLNTRCHCVATKFGF